MITVDRLCKSFDGKEVLHEISTVFRPGCCSLIIGASGSGKTVLLKSIVGLHEPDSGDIYYGNFRFNRQPLEEQKKIRRKIGMLFQGAALFDFATVEENIRFPMDFFTEWTPGEKKDRVDFCLERVNLAGANRKYPSELSGGMQKRVGIARAIALNPEYLFCDEPNSGLDPHTSILIDNLIAEITREFGTTTIINTHDMNSVMEIGDQISFIHKGRLKWEGDKSGIFRSDCPELDEFVFASPLARQLKSRL